MPPFKPQAVTDRETREETGTVEAVRINTTNAITPQQIAPIAASPTTPIPEITAQQTVAGVVQAGEFKDIDDPVLNEVKIDINPQTKKIRLSAPSYLVDSNIYREELAPVLAELSNLNLNSIELESVLTDGYENAAGEKTTFRDELNVISNLAKAQSSFLNTFKNNFPGATNEDATLYGAIISTDHSSKDAKITILDNGEEKVIDAKEYFETTKGIGDVAKEQSLKEFIKLSQDENNTTRERAIYRGMADFFLLNDNNRQAIEKSTISRLSDGADGFVSGLLTVVPFFGDDIQRGLGFDERIKENNTDLLQGGDLISGAGYIGGSIGALLADFVLAAGTGGAAAPKAAASGSRVLNNFKKIINNPFAKAGDNIRGYNKIEKQEELLRKVINSGDDLGDLKISLPKNFRTRFSDFVAEDIPFNVRFNLTQLPDNIEDADGAALSTLAKDILADAVLIGSGQVIKKTSNFFGATKLWDIANQSVTKKLAQGIVLLDRTPVIGGVKRSFKVGGIDGASGIRLATVKGIADGKYTTDDFKRVTNHIRSFQTGDGGVAADIIGRSTVNKSSLIVDTEGKSKVIPLGAWRNKSNALDNLKKGAEPAKRDDIEILANKYAVALNEIDLLKAGKKKAAKEGDQSTKQRLAIQQDFVKKIEALPNADDFKAFQQSEVAVQREVEDVLNALGLTDADMLSALRDNPAHRNYMFRQYEQLNPANQKTFGSSITGKSFEQFKKLSNKNFPDELGRELLGSQTAATKLEYGLNVAAQMRMHNTLSKMVDDGVLAGKVLKRPEDVIELGNLQKKLTTKYKPLRNIISKQTDNMFNDLPNFKNEAKNLGVEDIDSAFNVKVTSFVDDTVDELVKDSDFLKQTNEFLSEEGLDIPKKALAIELLLQREDEFIKAAREGLSKSGDLNPNQIKEISQTLRQAFKDKSDAILAYKELGDGGSGFLREVEDYRKLTAELPGEAKLPKPKAGEIDLRTVVKGEKGIVLVKDPEVTRYLTEMRNPVAEGVIRNSLENTARLFRATTTSLSLPAQLRNFTRDSLRALVTSGVGTLDAVGSISKGYTRAAGVSEEASDIFVGATTALQRRSTFADISKRGKSVANQVAREQGIALNDRVRINTIDLLNPKGFFSKAGLGKKLDALEDTLSAGEIVVRKRVGAAKFIESATKNADNTVDDALNEAAFYASNATTDFVNVGLNVRSMVRTMPYLTSAINGTSSFARVALTDPLGVTARLTTGVVAPATFLAVRNLSDPERAAVYWSLPDYERQNNIIIVVDDNQVIKIPLDQELAKIYAPVTEFFETAYGYNNESFTRIFGKAILNSSPFQLGELVDQDFQGQTDFQSAGIQILSNFIPQGVKPIAENLANRDFFTGNEIRPSENSLISRGQVDPEDEITGGDITYNSKDSGTLRVVADTLSSVLPFNISQSSVENIFSSYTGVVGNNLLYGLDGLLGAASLGQVDGETPQGGRAFLEDFSRSFNGGTYDAAVSDFWSAIDDLNVDKEETKTRINRLGSNAFREREAGNVQEADRLEQEKQKIIDSYGSRVGQMYDKWSSFYGVTGTLDGGQMSQLVELLNLGRVDLGGFEQGSEELSTAIENNQNAQQSAREQALSLGIPGTGSDDIFGRINEDGTLDSSGQSIIKEVAEGRRYGAPKQLLNDFQDAIREDTDESPSLFNLSKEYEPELDKAFDNKDYDKVDALISEYMALLDDKIKPIIDKYGPDIVLQNRKVLDEIDGYIKVPGDYLKSTDGYFFSSKKYPNINAYDGAAENYIKDRWGVGDNVTIGEPSDEEIQDAIKEINEKLDGGETARATKQAEKIKEKLDKGELFANNADAAQILSVIAGVPGQFSDTLPLSRGNQLVPAPGVQQEFLSQTGNIPDLTGPNLSIQGLPQPGSPLSPIAPNQSTQVPVEPAPQPAPQPQTESVPPVPPQEDLEKQKKVEPSPKTPKNPQISDPYLNDTGFNPVPTDLIKVAKDAGMNGEELVIFLAQVAHESVGFQALEEYASGAAYEGRLDLGNTQPGDGVRYKGRGFIQLTGRANYRNVGAQIGEDLENNPKLASRPDIAAKIAVNYWVTRVRPYGAQNSIDASTYYVNGGYNGYEDRVNRYNSFKNNGFSLN